jgi:hypothetical protein
MSMQRIKILEKLANEIRKDIHDECQVVYILSLIRKILEIDGQETEYKLLNFYCNWVLHSKMNRKSSTNIILNLLGKGVDCQKSGKENVDQIKSNDPEFFKLSSFKQELCRFLKNSDLSTKAVDKRWPSFRIMLLEIIKESPVTFTSNNLRQLELVRNGNNYCYKFSLKNCLEKPVIKLKIK